MTENRDNGYAPMNLCEAIYALGRRKAGSDESNRAREIILKNLQHFNRGRVTQEEFPLDVVRHSRASVSSAGKRYPAYLFDYTGILGELVQGAWIYAGKGRRLDIKRLKIEGKVVVMESDLCNHRYLQIQRASEAGALAVVIISKSPSGCEYGIGTGAMDKHLAIPAVSLAGTDAQQLMQGGTEIRIDFSSRIERAMGCNLIFDLPGTCSGQYIVVGAHYDSWTHGAQDNVAALWLMMMLIQRSCQHSGRYGYRFVFFDGEELGLCGSRYHVQHHALETYKAYLNLDAVVPSTNGRRKFLFYSPSMSRYLSRRRAVSKGFIPLSMNWL